MKRFLTLLVLLIPSVAIADCPESSDYVSHSITQGGFNQNYRHFYVQLAVNNTSLGTRYIYIGYNNQVWTSNGDVSLFNYIPLSVYESDPYLHGLYRAYSTGQLETDLQAQYNYPSSNNGSIDFLSYDAFEDNFWACEEPPATGGALDLGELIPWLSYLAMIGTVIAIATTFSFSLKVWDLILRAKNNPNFWCLFFLLALPSVASAQGSACTRVASYSGYNHVVNQSGNSVSFTFSTSYSDGYGNIDYNISYNFGSLYSTGYPGFSGIPYDVMISDPVLRNIWNGWAQGLLQNDLHQASLNGTPFVMGTYPDYPVEFCGCSFDNSNGACPNYQPSGPDLPVYCGDGETVDESPDDDDCGCPGQDYTVCDGGCPDADNDLCCDEVDPKPDDPNCTCTRAGPEGDCDSCPQCEKLLTEYMDDYKELFKEYGVDLSPFLGRGNNSSSMHITIPAPQGRFWWIFNQASWQFGIDENSVYPGALQNVVGTMRLVFRSLLLVLVLWIFTRSILRVVLR